jgi:hypothetical protein
MNTDDWEWPAHHEAGHIVVAEHFLHRTDFAWIGERDGQHSLDTKWRAEYGSEEKFRLEEIIILQAGRAALDHLCRRKHHYDDWQNSHDYKHSLSRALWLSDNDEAGALLLIQWAARRAECLVEKFWPQIQAVAFGLLEREPMRLTGDEAREIIERNKQSALAA